MYLCIISSDGEIVLHRNMEANPESLLKAIEPYRPDEEGIPFTPGHALYMKAIHRGKAKNDRIDSGKIAAMLRGGMFPMAYVYPAKMRALRDLLRRPLQTLVSRRWSMFTCMLCQLRQRPDFCGITVILRLRAGQVNPPRLRTLCYCGRW